MEDGQPPGQHHAGPLMQGVHDIREHGVIGLQSAPAQVNDGGVKEVGQNGQQLPQLAPPVLEQALLLPLV